MSKNYLRIYRGPENDPSALRKVAEDHSLVSRHEVTVSVGEVLPLLADAVLSDRTWLRDFSHDTITLSSDLYEVLMAYRHFRPSA